MCVVQDLRSRIGTREAVNRVCGGRIMGPGDELRLGFVLSGLGVGLIRPEDVSRGVAGGVFGMTWLWYWITPNIFSGFLLDNMTVVTPAAVAISAAMSFVSIPPVPRLDPSVVVLTGHFS